MICLRSKGREKQFVENVVLKSYVLTIKLKLNLKHFKVFLDTFSRENQNEYTKQLQVISMGQMNMKHGAMALFRKTNIVILWMQITVNMRIYDHLFEQRKERGGGGLKQLSFLLLYIFSILIRWKLIPFFCSFKLLKH